MRMRGATGRSSDHHSGDDVSAQGGPALFGLVRYWSRRWINQALLGASGIDEPKARQIQHIQIVEAVASATLDDGECTVGKLAHVLSLDQSGASRMVSDAVAAGYLTRSASERDRRRSTVELTPQGESLHHEAIMWQQRTFAALTGTWPAHDRAQFASYLHRLAGEVLPIEPRTTGVS